MTRPAISGATQLAAVIGDPVRHSLSPALHNAGFEALGLDWVYLALPVPAAAGAEAIHAMRTFGLDGLSVTMPHKQAVAATVDRQTAAVEALGACNCVFRDGALLVGDNTDGDGFVRSLVQETGASLEGASVLVLGAGGAAISIIDAVHRAGAGQLLVHNRNPARAGDAADIAPSARVVTSLTAAVNDADVIINATSVGMDGGPAPAVSPIDPDLIDARHTVADIVYKPKITPLLAGAAERGAVTVGGLGMLLHQAAIAFEHWTGHAAPIDAMAAALPSTAG